MRIYVINLPEAVERKASIVKEMEKTGLLYEFITPEKSEEIESKTAGWTTGANSLRLTTIKLVEAAIRDDVDCIWIWEDDCLIDKMRFDYTFKDFDFEKDFDFIHLNYSGGGVFHMEARGGLRLTVDGVYNCQSYLINKKVYKDYLELLQREVPIDQSTKDLHRIRRNSYVVEPAPVQHKENKYSYIREKIVNY